MSEGKVGRRKMNSDKDEGKAEAMPEEVIAGNGNTQESTKGEEKPRRKRKTKETGNQIYEPYSTLAHLDIVQKQVQESRYDDTSSPPPSPQTTTLIQSTR